jgi:chromatin remodeling complex protein RSC6
MRVRVRRARRAPLSGRRRTHEFVSLSEAISMAAKKKKKKAKKAAKKAAKKKAPKKAKAKKAKTKRTPNAAFMKAVTPSEFLAAVVGNKPIPRTEVTKRLWAYIRKNGLQDATNRRNINADDNLKAIFKKPQVNMFEMTKLVAKHLS